MKKMWKNTFLLVLTGGYLLLFLLLQLFSPEKTLSDSERRALQKKPQLTLDTIKDGSYMKDFETYTQDQFPFRDSFRGIKSLSSLGLFLQKEVNHLYVAEGSISKVEYPFSQSMLDHAVNTFQGIYDKFLKDTNVSIYSCVVPDKNYFLANKSGHLALDYEAFEQEFHAQTSFMTNVSIKDLLSQEDYYHTDSHWRQERILPIAKRLCEHMGASLPSGYETMEAGVYQKQLWDKPFYGVYYGQLALPFAPDVLYYLTSPVLERVSVTSYGTGTAKPSVVYNLEKAEDKDPYELFLSGADPLITIENPLAETDKELVVFRDSFGSSLVPLMVPAYKTVTLVDIRYLQSDFLPYFVEFDSQDVLFLYSTVLLNNSLGLH